MVQAMEIKELRPDVEGFVVTMDEGVCKQEVGPWTEGFDVLFSSEYIVTTDPFRTGLNHDYNTTLFISPGECEYYPLKMRIWGLEWEPFRVLRHVVFLNNGNCCLTMPVFEGTRNLAPFIAACLNAVKGILLR